MQGSANTMLISIVAIFSVILGTALGEGEVGEVVLAKTKGFKVIRKLGDGECGVAWLATNPNGAEICIKVAKQKKKALKDLRKEAKALETLRTDGICGVTQCYELFDDGEKNVEMVMNYVEHAVELRDCRDNEFTFEECCEILGQVATVLHKAHTTAKMTHKDLHAGNVLIGFKDKLHKTGIREIKVIDWSRQIRPATETKRGTVATSWASFKYFSHSRVWFKCPRTLRKKTQYDSLVGEATTMARRNSRGQQLMRRFARGEFDTVFCQ